MSVLNKKLEVQKEAVTKKTLACEELLADISSKTEQAKEKQQLAQAKSVEIEEQNKVIAVEKVYMYICMLHLCVHIVCSVFLKDYQLRIHIILMHMYIIG